MSPKQMNLLATLILVAAAALWGYAAFGWIAQRPAFAFKRIEIRGELQHVTAASIRAAIAGRLKGNYFTIRLDDARRLLETVPWVAKVSVRRAWPNRLQVTLAEHRALGSWDDGRLLSDAGELFVANIAEAEIHGPLPAFSGPNAAAADIARRFYEFSAQLAPLALTVDGVDVSDRLAWSLRVSGPGLAAGRLELGRDAPPSTLATRMERIVAAYPMVVAQVGGPPLRIDVRYPNGLAAAPPMKAR
jgi:cell division protein FtsQ